MAWLWGWWQRMDVDLSTNGITPNKSISKIGLTIITSGGFYWWLFLFYYLFWLKGFKQHLDYKFIIGIIVINIVEYVWDCELSISQIAQKVNPITSRNINIKNSRKITLNTILFIYPALLFSNTHFHLQTQSRTCLMSPTQIAWMLVF